MLLVLVVIIYLILLDELVMSSAQRRFGPFNIGVLGLLASIINGINLIIIASYFIMSSYSLIMFLGPLIFLSILLLFFSFLLPMFVIDVFSVYFLIILLSSLLVFVYFLLSYASFSKYSIIGSFRIVTQYLSFGLIFDVLLSIFLYVSSFLSFSLFSLSVFSSLSISELHLTRYMTSNVLVLPGSHFTIISSLVFILQPHCYHIAISFSHTFGLLPRFSSHLAPLIVHHFHFRDTALSLLYTALLYYWSSRATLNRLYTHRIFFTIHIMLHSRYFNYTFYSYRYLIMLLYLEVLIYVLYSVSAYSRATLNMPYHHFLVNQFVVSTTSRRVPCYSTLEFPFHVSCLHFPHHHHVTFFTFSSVLHQLSFVVQSLSFCHGVFMKSFSHVSHLHSIESMSWVSLDAMFASSFHWLFTLFPLFLFILFNLCILVESNRVPFDLPEAESELVAGFMTEFSSLYFSIIILSEYFSLIIFALFLVVLFNLNVLLSLTILFFYCLTRATLNRLKYDELLTFGWYFLLILTFSIFMLLIFIT